MGWVKDEFLDRDAYELLTPQLWDAMRDCVGLAIAEYNEEMDSEAVQATDCTARGSLCLRIHKTAGNASIELFLNAPDKSLRTAAGDGKTLRICSYRLMQGRQTLEFYGEDGLQSVDLTCRNALHDFLFKPFPKKAR